MDYSDRFLALTVAFSLLGFCLANLCPHEYRPYTCSSCVNFVKNEEAFSSNLCGGNGTLVQIQSSGQLDTLMRYITVLDHDQYWIGYEIKNGAAESVNDSTQSHLVTTLLNNQEQNCTEDCCVALKSGGPISVKCDEELPYICGMNINFPQLEESSPGSGGESVAMDGVSIMVNGQSFRKLVVVEFGSDVVLSCEHSSVDDVLWYVNKIQHDSDRIVRNNTHSQLELRFDTPGVYQCAIKDFSDISSVTLCGEEGTPGYVEFVSAYPHSQSELLVSWFPPSLLGTADPLLLRYTIYYTSAKELDINVQRTNVLPQLQNGESNVMNEAILSNLATGQTYTVGVVASLGHTSQPSASNVKFIAVAPTYGEAPDKSVSNLNAKRTPDDQTLVVTWDIADLQLPLGPVALYEVEYREYRDGQESVSTTAHVQPGTSFLVIRSITNANEYEVRVRILVEVKQDPLQHDRSSWTAWTRENGTTTVVPPGPLDTESSGTTDVDIIVASILVPLAVILVVALLLAVTIIWYWRSRKEDTMSSKQVEKFSPVHLQETNEGIGEKKYPVTASDV